VGPGVHSAYITRFLTGILHIRKNAQKSKFLPSKTFKWKKEYVFCNPRDATQNLCYALKKLPDHFNELH